MSRIANWWRTVGIVVGLELRQRTRTTRWRVLLGVFFLVVTTVVFGLYWFITTISPDTGGRAFLENLYFIVLGFVGFLGLVIAPTMTATSINGDRKDATLAVVQATPATGSQLATGKLLGAWIASCALLLVTAPYLIWAIVVAEYPPLYSILGVVVVALIFLSYCGIGLGLSALLSRPIGSAAITQLATLFLLAGLPIITALLVPATETRTTALQPDFSHNAGTDDWTCRAVPTEMTVEHTERIWWITAPNPLVIFADAAAQRDYGRDAQNSLAGRRYADYTDAGQRRPSKSALAEVADAVAVARTGPGPVRDRQCPVGRNLPVIIDDDVTYSGNSRESQRNLGRSWYWGLLANLALGGIGLAFAAHRLRVPAGRLPRGVRIA
ncbi:ABC transporter permease subunit [Tsukamurella serpentis]